MNLDQFGHADISLMDGERIDSSLDLSPGDNAGVVLLTDQRVIHVRGNGKRRNAVFASIQDVDAVEVTFEQEGYGALVWAALGLFVAVLLYLGIDNSAYRIVAPAVVAAMSVYLIVDRLTTPGRPLVIFKAGASQVRCDLEGDPTASEIYPFINRLYELKAANSSNGIHQSNRFAPR